MSNGLRLFKALLNHKFYEENKHLVIEDFFPRELGGLLDTLSHAHVQYLRDISVDELWDLHQVQNPTLTTANKLELETVLGHVRGIPDVQPEVYKDIIRTAWRQELARQAADKLLRLSEESDDVTIESIKEIVESIETENFVSSKVEYVTTDVSNLLNQIQTSYKWVFNIPQLAAAVGNIGPGTFGIISACPDVGKTCFVVNSIFGGTGFLEQGASVHYIGNEEPAERTMMRGINSWTGLNFKQIQANPSVAQEAFNKIKGNIFIQNSVDMTVDKLDAYCKERKPDIVIIDQLDKIKGTATKDSNDVNRLSALYTAIREIAKRRGCAIIGVCQSGAGAQGKLYYGYDDLYGSKTSKAGEADYIICIGMMPLEEGKESKGDTGYRMINIPKNKSPGGNKKPIPCKFNLELSRVVA